MLPIELDAAHVVLWDGDVQWKKGFLFGVQQALETQPSISVVVVRDAASETILAEFRRTWSNVKT